MAKTTNASDKFVVRMPDGMRDEISAASLANNRTLNAEFIARLSAPEKTLRDEFAMAAMSGVLASNYIHKCNWSRSDYANYAYTIADAMLAARGGDRD